LNFFHQEKCLTSCLVPLLEVAVVHKDLGSGLTPPCLSEFLLILVEFYPKALIIRELIRAKQQNPLQIHPSLTTKGVPT
jgi:hypothetical protein